MQDAGHSGGVNRHSLHLDADLAGPWNRQRHRFITDVAGLIDDNCFHEASPSGGSGRVAMRR
jgi:hypothetical protein